ncbi:hypothetical protein MTO96_014197, partial [Rhipicephalus appendiculatus]
MALQACCAEAREQRHSFGHIVEREVKFSTGHTHDDDDDDLEDCDLSCFLESSLLTCEDSVDTSPYVPLASSANKPSRMLSDFLLPCAEEPPNLLPNDEATSKPVDRPLADVVPKSPKADRPHGKSKSKRSPTSASSPSSSKKQGISTVSTGSRGKSATLSGRSAEDEELTALQASGNVRCPHSCRKCYNDCLNKLMALCDSQEVMKFGDALRQPFKVSKLRKSGETVDSESYMVDTGSKAPTATDTVMQLFSLSTRTRYLECTAAFLAAGSSATCRRDLPISATDSGLYAELCSWTTTCQKTFARRTMSTPALIHGATSHTL